MDNHISSICRFCLEEPEEFHHLALDCPALWFERHTINAQDPDHSVPHKWTPQQILDFSMFPRINEAFAKPLYMIEQQHQEIPDQPADSQHGIRQDPDDMSNTSPSDSEASAMAVSSLEDSSSDFLSVDSDMSF